MTGRWCGIAAGLLVGTAPGAVLAQAAEETKAPPAASDAKLEGESEATAPPKRVFYGPDGKPLPPELAKHIEERLKDQLPPPGTSGAQPTVRVQTLDGKPLPPELAKKLLEQFGDQLPPEAREAAQAAAGTAEADESAATASDASANSDSIVVSGERPRGSVNSDIPPERSFSQLDIRAFGAENIGALLDTIASQTASNRGRGDAPPVTLLNGRRVSDFAEIARIPSEAIERMEIFPEELALQYGYRADQKVVNIVTFPRYQSKVGQASFLTPGEGGRETAIGNADYLRIAGDTRIALGATYSHADNLRESERDVQQFAATPELAEVRTLLPENERFGVNGVLSGHVLKDISATLNGRVDVSRNESLLGRGQGRILRRDSDQTLVHFGTTIGGRLGRWQWTALGNFDRAEGEVLTDAADTPSRRDAALSTDTLFNADFLASGPVATLPAGPLSASLRIGGEFRDFTGQANFAGATTLADLSRDRGGVQADVAIPILSRTDEKASPLGNLTLSANVAYDRLSDAGTLWTYGFGLNWSPAKAIDLVASFTREEGAPTLEQLGGPTLVTPNLRTFDFVRREVVDINRVTGGNPALANDDRRLFRLGVTLRPLDKTDFSISADYVRSRTDNPVSPFPILTSLIETAFPERFIRDQAGGLQQIDARAVNFAEARQQQLRWGVNFTRPLGKVPDFLRDARVKVVTSEAEVKRLFPNATVVRAEPGSETAQGAANLTSRLYLSLYHNWFLEDELTLRRGGPRLDLLDGGAVDFLGGRRRHEVDLQAGAFKNGWGARVSANWRSATAVRDPGQPASDLRFDDYAIVNFNLFANLSEAVGGKKPPAWLKGTRLSLGVTNLFNTRPQVRDAAGTVPLSYQPAYLDPLGRVISFSLRKII
ncbi:TonB-dependent receptor domain-containing protein [Erythrobacter colymbi]|uniref:TonB-dependent receptor domain-containing protein n=1 Tax=Erythrobacter colymbi TaxID=1161202 RepID=UPI00138FDBE5|nr:TonB-dependent receptor [Erythrobacter colymbi]